jgi:hypothetical protein
MTLFAGVIISAGCAGLPPSDIADASAVQSPETGSKEHLSIDAIALGSAGLVASIDRHSWVARYGQAWIGSEAPFDVHDERTPDDHVGFAVIDQTPDRLQVVSHEDDANVAVWIERRDVAPTLVATTELTDEQGRTDPEHGVWLAPGTDVESSEALAAGAAGREIVVRDEMLAIRGWVPASVLDDVWVGDVPSDHRTDATSHIAAGGEIREAPSAAARVLAAARDDISVAVRGSQGDWQDVEIVDGPIRVRGFVLATSVLPEPSFWIRTGGFSSYGISDTDSLEVPDGACLFDRAGGQIVGVNLVQRSRYAGSVDTEWPRVYVNTPWDLVTVSVHVEDGRFVSCKLGDPPS